jgi:hypothetical protein
MMPLELGRLYRCLVRIPSGLEPIQKQLGTQVCHYGLQAIQSVAEAAEKASKTR